MTIRILIVDDHQMVCDGLRLILAKYPGAEVVGTCGDGATALPMVESERPDLVLMDIDLPDGSGLALSRRIRERWPKTMILVLTGHEERHFANEAIQAGARGYLVKTRASAELFAAVRTIMAGGIHLSADIPAQPAPDAGPATEVPPIRTELPLREAQVLELVARGYRNKEIAIELHLGVKTVETYRGRLMKRLGCASPGELVRHAIREGYVRL